jgi:hypothetical protein
MKEQQRAEAVVETVSEDPSRPDGATDIYLIFDGRRIAKRGKPGTLHASGGELIAGNGPYARACVIKVVMSSPNLHSCLQASC